MGVLVKRHLFDPKFSGDDRLQPEIVSVREREDWAGLYFNNKKIGYVNSEIIPIEEGYIIKENLFMDMEMMGVGQKLESSLHTITDRSLGLSLFNFRFKSGDSVVISYGNVENNEINLTTVQGKHTQKKKIPITDTPMFTNSLKYYALKKGLKPGTSFQRSFFDPMTFTDRQIQVDVIKKEDVFIHGVKYSAYKIKQSYLGIEVFSWITEDAITLKEESPMGIVLLKEDKEYAKEANWAESVDIVSAVAVIPEGEIPQTQLERLNLALKNISFEGLNIHGERQVLYNDSLEITKETVDKSNSYILPYNGMEFQEYLNPSLFIQSDERKIIATAQKLIHNKTDSVNAVEILNSWVYSTVEKTLSMSIPSALEVIKTKKGDCNEHAVLLTALLRAAGIPARICSGLAFIDGKFYYHAWVEAYLNNWISVDPTFGEFPAPVTNIKLVHGDFESMIKILNIVGRIEIQVLDFS